MILSSLGAPIDYVRTGKFLGDASYLTLHNKAPHPNAAKAFIDFFLNEESMSIMAKAGEFVHRKGNLSADTRCRQNSVRRNG